MKCNGPFKIAAACKGPTMADELRNIENARCAGVLTKQEARLLKQALRLQFKTGKVRVDMDTRTEYAKEPPYPPRIDVSVTWNISFTPRGIAPNIRGFENTQQHND